MRQRERQTGKSRQIHVICKQENWEDNERTIDIGKEISGKREREREREREKGRDSKLYI